MKIDELKEKVEAYRHEMKTRNGICFHSAQGPIGIALIDHIVTALDAQQKRIEELETKVKA